ncbi:MAG TPA: protein kinase [Blastocatellia bacterium]|nr:protein kinase [Blastocatellia bacterium]
MPDPFELPIGAGGIGEVFLARDTKLERQVAIKLLSEEFSKHPDRLHHFTQEARAVSALNHPDMLTIHEIGETNGTHYLATEYIEGETLRHHPQQS